MQAESITTEQTVYVGEKRNVWFQLAVTGGTTTLASATFTLYTSGGAAISGLTNLPVTIIDSTGTTLSGQVLLDLTSNVPGLTDDYTGVFTVNLGGGVVKLIEVRLHVLAPPQLAFSYNVNTNIGMVRFWIGDTDSSSPIFSDAEINMALTVSNNNVLPAIGCDSGVIYMAAWACLTQMATSAAKKAKVSKIAIFSDDTFKTFQAIRQAADDMRQRALLGMDAAVTDQTVELAPPWTAILPTGDKDLSTW